MLLALKHTLKLGDSHFHPHHLPVEYAQLLQRLDDALPPLRRRCRPAVDKRPIAKTSTMGCSAADIDTDADKH